jgi:hypothetical protein
MSWVGMLSRFGIYFSQTVSALRNTVALMIKTLRTVNILVATIVVHTVCWACSSKHAHHQSITLPAL